jgi:hypothetical protein
VCKAPVAWNILFSDGSKMVSLNTTARQWNEVLFDQKRIESIDFDPHSQGRTGLLRPVCQQHLFLFSVFLFVLAATASTAACLPSRNRFQVLAGIDDEQNDVLRPVLQF